MNNEELIETFGEAIAAMNARLRAQKIECQSAYKQVQLLKELLETRMAVPDYMLDALNYYAASENADGDNGVRARNALLLWSKRESTP